MKLSSWPMQWGYVNGEITANQANVVAFLLCQALGECRCPHCEHPPDLARLRHSEGTRSRSDRWDCLLYHRSPDTQPETMDNVLKRRSRVWALQVSHDPEWIAPRL